MRTAGFFRACCDARAEERAGGLPRRVVHGETGCWKGILPRLVANQWKASCAVPYRHSGCCYLSQGPGGSTSKLQPHLEGTECIGPSLKLGHSCLPRVKGGGSSVHALPGCFLCNRGSFLPLTPRVLFFFFNSSKIHFLLGPNPLKGSGVNVSPKRAGAKKEKVGLYASTQIQQTLIYSAKHQISPTTPHSQNIRIQVSEHQEDQR